MRLEERRLLKFGLIGAALVAAVPITYLGGLVIWGSSLTPPPVPSPAAAPTLIKDALWARAGGGRATELRGVNPINLAGLMVCTNLSGAGDNPDRLDAERLAECAKWLPALHGLEYLSGLHAQDHQVKRASFRGGASAMATMLRLSHSWTRDEFLHTLAARAEFGYGWHGVEAAARGFFGRSAAALSPPQAALIASRLGDTRTDPWCEPAAALVMRNAVLERMRNNNSLSDTQYEEALTAALELGAPPSTSDCR